MVLGCIGASPGDIELGAQANEQTAEEPAVVELTEQEQGPSCDFRADV